MQFFVRGGHRTITVDGLLPCDLVGLILAEAEVKLGIRCSDAWLTFGGKPLKPACMLGNAGIHDGVTLQLAFRGRGGGCSGSKPADSGDSRQVNSQTVKVQAEASSVVKQLRGTLQSVRSDPLTLSVDERKEAAQLCAEWLQVLTVLDAEDGVSSVATASLDAAPAAASAATSPAAGDPPRGASPGGNSLQTMRERLKRAQQQVVHAHSAVDQMLPDSGAKRRGGQLLTLGELIGSRPAHSWESEWATLRSEHRARHGSEHRNRTHPSNQLESVDELSQNFKSSIDRLHAKGWGQRDARAYAVLSTCRDALGRAVRERDSCYAASVYAISEALYHAPSRVCGSRGSMHVPKRLYFHRSGLYSLTQAEPSWALLEDPDPTGFQGLTSHAMTRVLRRPGCFSAGGFVYRVTHGVDSSEDIHTDCDVVCFESAPDDEQGAHAAILLDSDEVSVVW